MVDPLGQLTTQKCSGLLHKKSSRKPAKILNYEVAGGSSRERNGGKETSWDGKQSMWAA